MLKTLLSFFQSQILEIYHKQPDEPWLSQGNYQINGNAAFSIFPANDQLPALFPRLN